MASPAAPDPTSAPASPEHTELPPPSPPRRLVDWGLSENTNLESSAESLAVAQIAQTLAAYFDADPPSDDEMEERSEGENDGEEINEPTITGESLTTAKRPRMARTGVNNVDDVPSVKSMQELNAMLQKLCGIESIPYNGALGHKYYVNSLAQLIAQEMSNPKVRPHLQFYPEDSGKILQEARQGTRWLEELPSEQTTPMARIGTQDYYLNEPAMLTNGTCRIPVRWFARDKVLFAKCWDLETIETAQGHCWRAVKRESEVPQTSFLKNFVDLQNEYQWHHIPDPSKIQGTTEKWTLTDPAIGNPWRERAKGSRVYCFPIWLYCDDTSGNLSKKWNEHNSFLFTPAGLSREQSAKEFNIHFLSTSNIAPPLEMLDGILDQLEAAQEDGVWAWDCELGELVLLIPAVLALLGDNPMQSEFACHIGLRGKYFCRACWVKGSDSMEEAEEDVAAPGGKGSHTSDAGSPTEDRGSSPGRAVSPASGRVGRGP
ncbi:hypothetical protein C8R46DRAFT_1285735 [Mycena filopes]|nr:hypothetical protein C8R46DRAFT_1285735 [Mycena filopes]